MNQPAEELVQRAREGDREAFQDLVEAVRARLEALFRARIGPNLRAKLEVEDAMQETLSRAYQSIASFEWRGEGSFFRWLAGIAERVILEASRKSERRRTLALKSDLAAQGPSPSRVLRRKERLERLQKALEGLSAEQREVVILARIDGLPTKEIAERTGRSPGAVRQLLSRALKNLRLSFGDTESLGLPAAGLERTNGVDDGQP